MVAKPPRARSRPSVEAEENVASELQPTFSLVLRTSRGAMIDFTDARLLDQIEEKSSISRAAREIGISYRNAWDRLNVLQSRLGEQVVDARAGGKSGGGAELTPEGRSLVLEYRHLNDYLLGALGDRDFWQHVGYRLSARNRIRARIAEVKSGSVISEVRMEIRLPGRLTSIITNEAVRDLDLKPGDVVEAIIKATEIVLAKARRA